jgi:hypothetical protein
VAQILRQDWQGAAWILGKLMSDFLITKFVFESVAVSAILTYQPSAERKTASALGMK